MSAETNNIAALHTAMLQIEAVLREHDIAGVVVIHKDNVHQSSIQLKTSNTASFFTPENAIKIDPSEFASLDKKIMAMANTSNLLYHLYKKTEQISKTLMFASKDLDVKLKAKHTDFEEIE